jgi:drug/metabolite transporter (DMT)-like permease
MVLTIVAFLTPWHATTWNIPYLLAVLYNIVLATALGYTLWVYVLDVLPARDAGMGTLATPVVGSLAAWLQLGEAPTRLSAIGMVLIVTGLVALSLADRRATR